MNVKQFKDSNTCTCSYLLWDRSTRNALIIDPVLEQVSVYTQALRENKLKLRYSMETHLHDDHVTGSGKLRKLLGCTVMLHENSNAKYADILLRDRDRLPLGEHRICVMHTPGITSSDVCYFAGDMVFTGDTLLINDCGQIDHASGDAGTLYDSITSCLFTLPGNIVVYPGHDYQDKMHSTIFAEKSGNAKVGGGRSRDDFIRLMSAGEAGPLRRTNEAITANLSLGLN